jgi:hypothetical protein
VIEKTTSWSIVREIVPVASELPRHPVEQVQPAAAGHNASSAAVPSDSSEVRTAPNPPWIIKWSVTEPPGRFSHFQDSERMVARFRPGNHCRGPFDENCRIPASPVTFPGRR